MSVETKVLALMKTNDWVDIEDFERIFPSKEQGHKSWDRRMRGLRKKGYIVEKRRKSDCPNTWEFRLVIPDNFNEPPDTDIEASQRRNNYIRETSINYKVLGQGQLAIF